MPEICAAFEVNETRVDHTARPKLFVADGMANWGLVIGDGAAPKDNLAKTKIELFVDGVSKTTSPENLVMDDPFLSLSRLCAQLHRRGLGVKAGQHVITGSFLKYRLGAPGRYSARFHGIGEVALVVP